MNLPFLTAERPLKIKVEKIEGAQVKLKFADRQTMLINLKFLPKDVKEGEILYIGLFSGDELNKTKEEIAKSVLAEILGSK